MKNGIGEFLRDWRRSKGISAAKLAQDLKIAPSQISRWEKGTEPLPLTNTLIELADYLSRATQSSVRRDAPHPGDTRASAEKEHLIREAFLAYLGRSGREKLLPFFAQRLSCEVPKPDRNPRERLVVRVSGEDQPGVLGVTGQYAAQHGYNVRKLAMDIMRSTAATEDLLIIVMEVEESDGDEHPSRDDFSSGLADSLRDAGMETAQVYVSVLHGNGHSS